MAARTTGDLAVRRTAGVAGEGTRRGRRGGRVGVHAWGARCRGCRAQILVDDGRLLLQDEVGVLPNRMTPVRHGSRSALVVTSESSVRRPLGRCPVGRCPATTVLHLDFTPPAAAFNVGVRAVYGIGQFFA